MDNYPNIPEDSSTNNASPPLTSSSAEPSSANATVTPVNDMPIRKHKMKWLLPLILLGVLLLGGGAAAYIQFVQNSPERIWKRALANSAEGFDQLLELTTRRDLFKGRKVTGSLSVASPVTVSASFSGQWNGGNGNGSTEISGFGATLKAEVRTFQNEISATPDVYVKVKGLNQVAKMFGSLGAPESSDMVSLLKMFDDQWYLIDSKLMNRLNSSVKPTKDPRKELSDGDIEQFTKSISQVFRDKFFAADGPNAVFVVNEQIGKEDFEGDKAYKFKVGVNKEGFKVFLVSLKEAIKNSRVDDVLLADRGQTLDESLQFNQLLEQIDKADFSKVQAHVWVESQGKFVRNVRIYPVEDGNDTNYVDLAFDYNGGDIYPFMLRTTVAEQNLKGTAAFGFDLNRANANSRFWIKADMDSQPTGASYKLEGELKVEGTNDDVAVEIPKDAKKLDEVIDKIEDSLMISPFMSAPGSLAPPSQLRNDDIEL